MERACHIGFVYLSWAVYLAGLTALLVRGEWLFAAAWLVFAPFCQWVYIRQFPRLSVLMGYGRLDDAAPSGVVRAPRQVTIYTALGCPFCPVMERRLEGLQKRMDFELQKVDITARPGILSSKGIRSVPVIEVGERRLVGVATSELVARFIAA